MLKEAQKSADSKLAGGQAWGPPILPRGMENAVDYAGRNAYYANSGLENGCFQFFRRVTAPLPDVATCCRLPAVFLISW